MRDNLKSRISHIFRLHLSYCFFPFITNATFFFFFIKQHFASQLTDIYMQGSIQERLSSCAPVLSIAHPNRCTPVNRSLHYSEQFRLLK